ncbi:MAG: radical SAM protein [bacterium]
MTANAPNSTPAKVRPVPPPGEFPRRVTVELTNRCNLRCPMCPRHLMETNLGNMEPMLFRQIIDDMAQVPGTALVPFFRGESLLHPQCVEMIAYAKEQGIVPIQFTTNATQLTPEVSKALIDLKVDFISFSVDSVDPETYASIRPGASLEQVLKNIRYFCDYRRHNGTQLPEIQVSVVKTSSTAKQIPQFVKYWRGLVDRVRVYEQHSEDGNFGSLAYATSSHPQVRQACHKPFTDLVIYWDGSVALCNHDWVRENALGNVDCHTIAEIWQSESYQRVRNAHLNDHNSLEALCRSCDHWQSFYLPEGQIGELYD